MEVTSSPWSSATWQGRAQLPFLLLAKGEKESRGLLRVGHGAR